MSDSTPRLGLPDLPDTPELYADTVSDAFWRLDALGDLCLKGQFVDTPPVSPADGDAWLVGGSPNGAWSGQPYKIAACRDGGWQILTPFNGLRAFVEGESRFIIYQDGVWSDWTSLIGAAEDSIASAATCDIGAAGSLFLQITGTTAITSLGTAANRLRLLRFAGALTLTHDATSLVLPGGASIVTAAGDTAIFTSDGSGHWRCRHYSRADGRMVNMASPTFTGNPTVPNLTLDNGTGNANIDYKVGGSSKAGIAYVPASDYLTIYQAGADRIKIDTNGLLALNAGGGNVAVGTGIDGGPFGDARLCVASASGHGLMGYSTGFGWAGALRIDTLASGTGYLLNINCNGTDVGAITYSGGTTLFNTTSDARLKNVLAEQVDYRAAIKALWVGDFVWKATGAKGFGVLAQQAYEIMPHRMGVTRPADDAGQWHASAEPFGHLALWGVKDLYALVEALAARVAILEAAHAAG